MPSQEELREHFDYNPLTGLLSHRTPKKGARIGLPILTQNDRGYRVAFFRLRQYRQHKLIWIYLNGSVPDGMTIDHIDGNTLDNRPDNLRLATRSQNQRNRKVPTNNKSGCMGVHWDKTWKRWKAKIRHRGQYITIGGFKDISDAIAARRSAERKYDYHPNHGKR